MKKVLCFLLVVLSIWAVAEDEHHLPCYEVYKGCTDNPSSDPDDCEQLWQDCMILVYGGAEPI